MISIEITDPNEFHCFRLTLGPAEGADGPAESIEIMLHARVLVELIHQCSVALCEWQRATTEELLRHITGITAEEMRSKGIIAPSAPEANHDPR